MSDNLFDPDEFLAPGKTPKPPPRRKPERAAIKATNHRWVTVATVRGTLNDAHIYGRDVPNRQGSMETACGRVGRLLVEHNVGTEIHPCPKCMAAVGLVGEVAS